ncbi:MAG: RluA family pseudouridine synthase [Tissierellia bacterium]|nr:RluA family pseudouridine synthase [Tissierellia bacterium]
MNIPVDEAASGLRLDQFLAEATGESRSQLKKSITEGRVQVDGKVQKPAYLLSEGELVHYEPPLPQRVHPKDLKLKMLYEDEDLAFVDKPWGLVVHPGAGREETTLVHGLLYALDRLAEGSDPLRPGIVHRLDKDTSGVMVVAKTDRAYRALVSLFKEHRLEKIYRAVVEGQIFEPGQVEAPIGRDPKVPIRMAVREDGRAALTRYRPLAVGARETALELSILTGRTHQIRVHMKSLGHPVVGDELYGARRSPHRTLLHAHSLSLKHPFTGAELKVVSPLPEDILGRVEKIKSEGRSDGRNGDFS